MSIDKLEKAFTVTVNAETIGEGEGDLSSAFSAGFSRCDESLFGLRAIPEVALEIENLGVAMVPSWSSRTRPMNPDLLPS
jgi:hypothetical protein